MVRFTSDPNYTPASRTQLGTYKLEKVEITLADCLACSGCITSAEGVLITQQSQEEVLRVLNENNEHKRNNGTAVRTIVCTVSAQSVLSLAHKYKLSVEEALRRLAGYLKELGVDYVLNTRIADDLALLESRDEFVRRFALANNNAADRTAAAAAPLPMLASSCPGWVCYAEKTHGTFILPYISTTRSPQQIMGALVKQRLSAQIGVSAASVYHVTVMPCYDKKLEASREDFYSEANESRDVDCVITSSECFFIYFFYCGLCANVSHICIAFVPFPHLSRDRADARDGKALVGRRCARRTRQSVDRG